MQAWEEKYYEREEGREEGLVEGREEGSKFKLLEQLTKKLRKDKTPETIAEELEEDEDTIQHLCAVAKNFAPDYDLEQIYKKHSVISLELYEIVKKLEKDVDIV